HGGERGGEGERVHLDAAEGGVGSVPPSSTVRSRAALSGFSDGRTFCIDGWCRGMRPQPINRRKLMRMFLSSALAGAAILGAALASPAAAQTSVTTTTISTPEATTT